MVASPLIAAFHVVPVSQAGALRTTVHVLPVNFYWHTWPDPSRTISDRSSVVKAIAARLKLPPNCTSPRYACVWAFHAYTSVAVASVFPPPAANRPSALNVAGAATTSLPGAAGRLIGLPGGWLLLVGAGVLWVGVGGIAGGADGRFAPRK